MRACGIEVTVQDVTYMHGPMEKGGVLGSNGTASSASAEGMASA
jgi:hypothetical protein